MLTAGKVMIREPITASPEDTVARAMLTMTVRGIGGMPVVGDDGELLGMITHRDLILAGREAERLRVRDIMTTKLVTVEPRTPVRRVAEIMCSTGLQRLPVVEGKRLVGLVTQSCLLRVLLQLLSGR
ncbi:MAG: CBS domain-containing protein [Euryarchaeota archaeon]|nr:CBS domain-containing protein [Euryarchaeota archaeon]